MEFWRVRMKVGNNVERSEEAWDRDEAGSWYGAWTVGEWKEACLQQPKDPWVVLKQLPHQKNLGWNSKPDVAAIRRLEAIGIDDWVVVFLRGRGEIGLARLEPGLKSADDHPLNQRYSGDEYEIFKYRTIVEKKTFALAQLPDAYRLLPSQGRGNLHRFHGMRGHVRLLAEYPNAEAVRAAIAAMPFDQLIDILGASAWESVCTGYLTLEHSFVPTGLRTGSTLPTFDIIGRSTVNGAHILAQCKKNPGPVGIPEDFLDAIDIHVGTVSAFYFAFGGCYEPVPENVNVIGRKEILHWAQTGRGAMYREFLIGE